MAHTEQQTQRRSIAAWGVVALVCVTVFHLLMVVLHTAPDNPVSRSLSAPVRAWTFPYFKQDWHLFAPNPGLANEKVLARLRLRTGQELTETEWVDLSAEDWAAIRRNPFPSRFNQTQLDYAIGYYGGSIGKETIKAHLANIALQRLSPRYDGVPVAVQVRWITDPIAPPPGHPVAPEASEAADRVLPWWDVI